MQCRSGIRHKLGIWRHSGEGCFHRPSLDKTYYCASILMRSNTIAGVALFDLLTTMLVQMVRKSFKATLAIRSRSLAKKRSVNEDLHSAHMGDTFKDIIFQ